MKSGIVVAAAQGLLPLLVLLLTWLNVSTVA